MASDDDLRAAAETAIDQCLALSAGERCAVVTDDKRRRIGEVLYDAASAVTDGATLHRYQPGDQHGAEPPEPVAAALRAADAFLAPTTKSLSHTRARDRATGASARGATLPGITEAVFVAGLDADYESIRAECDRLLDQVADAATVRVTTPRGTDLTVEPGGRAWRRDTGVIREPEAFSNLPAGEVFVSPADANGTYVVDGTMMPHGLLEDPIEFAVEDGYVTDVSDDAVREQLDAAAEEVGEAAYNLAELGIGANLAVESLAGSVLLDEKAAGTVHVAVGDDASIGGDTEAPVHLDGIIREPTVYADGEAVTLPTPD
jgi:leucyl aminopeptidase (aminopeptidase T)